MDGWTGWSDSLMDVAVWPPGPASKRGEPVEVGHRRGEVRVLVAVSRSRPTVLGWFCGFTILHAADPELVSRGNRTGSFLRCLRPLLTQCGQAHVLAQRSFRIDTLLIKLLVDLHIERPDTVRRRPQVVDGRQPTTSPP